MKNILMIFLGMTIWQFFILFLALFNKLDSDNIQIATISILGIWGLLWVIIVNPITFVINKIRMVIFNKKYICLLFWQANTNGLFYCTTFWAKQDVVEKLYITDDLQKENRNCVQIIDMKIGKMPCRDEILIPDKLENGCKGWTKDFLHKFLK